MGSLTFLLKDSSEQRVMADLDISKLESVVGALSQSPGTIGEFNRIYQQNTGKCLFNDPDRGSSLLLKALRRQCSSEDEALKKLMVVGLGEKGLNYQSFSPDQSTPYDIPSPTGSGLNLCEALSRVDEGILVVDLRAKEVRYLSQNFDITKSGGQYHLPDGWRIKSCYIYIAEKEK